MRVKSTSKKTAFTGARIIAVSRASGLTQWARIRAGDDDRGLRRDKRAARGLVNLVAGDSLKQARQANVVIQTEAEKFLRLQKVRDAEVCLQGPRHGTDQVLLRLEHLGIAR